MKRQLKNLTWTSNFNEYLEGNLPVDFYDFLPFRAFFYEIVVPIGETRFNFYIEGFLECNLPVTSDTLYYDYVTIKGSLFGIDVCKSYKIHNTNQRIEVIRSLMKFLDELKQLNPLVTNLYNGLIESGFMLI